MRRSVHKRNKGQSDWTLPPVAEWIGFRFCYVCEAVITPCPDCGDPWEGPCPFCLAPMFCVPIELAYPPVTPWGQKL